MKEVLKKVGSVIGKAILILFVIFFIMEMWIIFQSVTKEDKIPDVFGIKPMIVLTGSMETQIGVGDLAFVKEVETSKLEEGDIIAFRNADNTVTTHRIVEITEVNGEIQFTTKGDNNNAKDVDTVSESQIEGKYIFKIAGLGNFLMYIKEPRGLAAIMIIIVILGLIWIIGGKSEEEWKMTTEYKKHQREFEEFKKLKEVEKLKNAEKENVR